MANRILVEATYLKRESKIAITLHASASCYIGPVGG